MNAREQPVDHARLITRSEEKIRFSGAGPKHAAIHRGGSLQCPDDAGAYGHHAAAVLAGIGDRADRRLGDLEALRHRQRSVDRGVARGRKARAVRDRGEPDAAPAQREQQFPAQRPSR